MRQIAIVVQPDQIVLNASSTWVTVHTDIAYAEVVPSSVKLNGIPARVTKSDDCGDLVAKFVVGDIRAIVAPPSAVLTLTGLTKTGVPFSGTDTVRVK